MEILSLIVIILIAFFPGVFWLLFFLLEEVHPEPKRMIAYVFSLGFIMSAPIIVMQIAGNEFIKLLFPSSIPESTIGFIIIFLLAIFYPALIEEVFKFFAAFFAVNKTRFLKTPVDAMIYMIAAGLGLATFENIGMIMNIISEMGALHLSEILDITILRFVGATLLHALASAFVGYYWAKSKLLGVREILWFGITLATIVHSMFNYLILEYATIGYLIIPTSFLMVVSFFVFRGFDDLRLSFVEFPYIKK